MTRNLWGDLPVSSNQRAPVTILKEQAEMLGRMTGGVLTGTVNLTTERRTFYLTFTIVAPALDYTYTLLRAEHTIDMYPVRVKADEQKVVGGMVIQPEIVECATEEEFESALADVFAAPKTRSVIASLRAQSKEI